MVLWVRNLGKTQPGDSSIHTIPSLDGMELAPGGVWRVQDGFTHLLGTLMEIAGRVHSAGPCFFSIIVSEPLDMDSPARWSNFLQMAQGSKKPKWKLPVLSKARLKNGMLSRPPF